MQEFYVNDWLVEPQLNQISRNGEAVQLKKLGRMEEALKVEARLADLLSYADSDHPFRQLQSAQLMSP